MTSPLGIPALRSAVACLWIASAGAALGAPGDTCEPAAPPAFAGHALPLDAVIEPTPVDAVEAFPDLPWFESPVFLTAAGDGSDRLFVLEQFSGKVRVFDNDFSVNGSSVYLNLDQAGLSTGALSTGSEKGLLGLAFDPEFAQEGADYEGALYIYYSATKSSCACSASTCNHCSKIVRFTATSASATSVDIATAELILEVPQERSNHNGGMLAFGPHDGLLYISLGDAGGSNDTFCNGQNLDTLLGSILRIDPHSGSPYAIPLDNPEPLGVFDGRPEIWHYGLRNPWRFSFDRNAPHDMWIGDVGQGKWEEVDYVPQGAAGGINFGWNQREGAHDFGSVGGCSGVDGVDPVLEYPNPNDSGAAIVGGYVYRGASVPELYGSYLFADSVSGEIWAWDRVTVNEDSGLGISELLLNESSISSFGEDEAGELYIVMYNGQIQRLEPAAPGGATFPSQLSATGLFSDTANLTPAIGLIEYEVESALWSDRAAKRRWLALPANQRIGFHATGSWDFPVGTALVKHFELPAPGGGDLRLETRVLLLQPDGWTGFTYHWNEAQTDADLLTRGLSEVVEVEFGGLPETQIWNYPSPSLCSGCHTDAGGRILGVRARQLNFAGPASDNQLDHWNCIGLFDTDIGENAQFGRFSAIDDSAETTQQRARSYLTSNCAFCHSPGAPAPGGLDLRYDTLLGSMNVIGIAPTEGELGLGAPERIDPGTHANSVLWHRMQSADPSIRMAKTTGLAHDDAVIVFADWIDIDLPSPDSDEDGVSDAIDNCPAVANADQTNGDPDALGDACDPDQAADLRADSQIPSAVGLGQRLALSATVENIGYGAAAASQVTLHLSADTHFDEGDALVGDCFVGALDAAQSADCTDFGATVPPDLAELAEGETAQFYWATCADSLELVFESDEANNCAIHPSPVTVPEPTAATQWAASAITLSGLALWPFRRRPSR